MSGTTRSSGGRSLCWLRSTFIILNKLCTVYRPFPPLRPLSGPVGVCRAWCTLSIYLPLIYLASLFNAHYPSMWDCIRTVPCDQYIYPTLPSLQTVSRECHGFRNPRGLQVRVGTGAGTGWQFTTLGKPAPVAWVDGFSQVCKLPYTLYLIVHR
jgi:hypothetical protein